MVTRRALDAKTLGSSPSPAAMLERWKEGNYYSGEISCKLKPDGTSECTTIGGDFGVAECTGTYFQTSL